MAKSKPSETIRVETIARSPILYTLEVEIDAARVRKAFDRAYRDLGKEVRLKGFRPGKAPRSVLERLYGASVAEQLENTLVGETLADAVELSGIEPVSEPAIEASKPVPDAPFRYTANVEVRPPIELPDLDGLAAIRPQVDVLESEVDERLEMLRSTNAPLIEEPDGTAIALAHILTIDFVGTIEGEPFEGGSGKGVQLEVGDGGFIPGFEDQLIGAHSGDDVDVRVTFPDDFANSEIAGKQAAFAVHIVDVRRRHLPEIDDEFAKDLGEFDSLEALRERIRADLESARERESKDTFRTSLMDALLERMEFEVPPGMIERQLHNQLASAGRRLEGRVDEAAIRAQLDRWQEEWRPNAERDVREMLVLQAIAADREIEVEDDEVHARISEMLGEQQGEASDLQRMKQDEQLVTALRLQLRDDKVLEFLAERAKIRKSSENSET